MNRRVIIITLVVLALAVFFVVAKNRIATAMVGGACKAATGLELKISRLKLSLLSGQISAKGIKLYNPSGFEDKVMFDIPEFEVALNIPSVFKGRTQVTNARLYISEINIVRDQNGQLNLNALKPAGSKKTSQNQQPSKTPKIRIDQLYLRIDKAVYRDYARGITQEFDLRIEETYRDIRDIRALVPLIIGKALTNSALRSLANFDVTNLLQNFQSTGIDVSSLGLGSIQGLGGELTNQMQAITGGMPDVSDKAKKVFQGLFQSLGGDTSK